MARTPRLGCIADDFTGATDLANNLVRAGMRVVQSIGTPSGTVEDADAVIIALKSRTIPAEEAVAQSLAALEWLQDAGCEQIYFKVCSTFDSTPAGNIGPVAEALAGRLGGHFCCVTPAFPVNGRKVFNGYLFVGDVLLNESGMRNHPLTPMTDANLVRVLQSQLAHSKVGLIGHDVVRKGSAAISAEIAALEEAGISFGIVDAIDEDDLMALGAALIGAPLVVAGSGVAIGLPQNFGIEPSSQASGLPAAHGFRAIVSGSCSVATNAQVAAFVESGGQALALDPAELAQDAQAVERALEWANSRVGSGPVLLYTTAAADEVKAVQTQLGSQAAGSMIEAALASVARGLVAAGVGQLLVAGGETSGACVLALEISQLRIGPQIDPGVPWCFAQSAVGPVHIALKSGNFGTRDFFTKAFAQLA